MEASEAASMRRARAWRTRSMVTSWLSTAPRRRGGHRPRSPHRTICSGSTPATGWTPYALYELAALLNAEPGLALIYFDSDEIDDLGRSDAFHKPGWSPDYLECHDYIGSAACFDLGRAENLLSLVEGRYDLTLRMTGLPRRRPASAARPAVPPRGDPALAAAGGARDARHRRTARAHAAHRRDRPRPSRFRRL